MRYSLFYKNTWLSYCMLVITLFILGILAGGCGMKWPDMVKSASPIKPPTMNISGYHAQRFLELELAPGVFYTAIVCSSADSQVTDRLVLRLFAWQEKMAKWKEVYSESLDASSLPELKVSRIIPDRDSLVIYSIEGSGSFVYLRVLSYYDNQYQTIIKPEPQGRSRVLIENEKVIIESASGRQTIYTWNGSTIVVSQAQRAPVPTATADISFQYHTLADGKIELPSDKIIVNVGDVLHIVQGQSDAQLKGVRLLWNRPTDNLLEFQEGSLEQHEVYKAVGPGLVILTIIGNGGYDWGHARAVEVKVVQ